MIHFLASPSAHKSRKASLQFVINDLAPLHFTSSFQWPLGQFLN